MGKRTPRLLALFGALLVLAAFAAAPARAWAATNLAAGKPVTASAAYDTMPASNLTDDDRASRWSTESAPPQWAYVDLGSSQQMDRFSVIWESDTNYASSFDIYVSGSAEDWGDPVASVSDNARRTSTVELDEPVAGRYVRLSVTAMHGYPNVSACDFSISLGSDETPADPTENVALGMTGAADSTEAASLGAGNAFDGDTSSKSSRWASAVDATESKPGGPHWIYVDLGQTRDVKTVRVFWEMRKANGYRIDIAPDDADPAADSSDWQTVYKNDGRPASTTDTISLDQVHQARYVRLYIEQNTFDDPGGGTPWGNISIYEMEVYGGAPAMGIGDVANMISVAAPGAEDTKLSVTLPEVEGYTVEYRGTDLEQIVDAELNINRPLIDKEVKLAFKVTEGATGKYVLTEVPVTVPGGQQANTGNAAPVILPELSEWAGGSGVFDITGQTSVYYTDASLANVVERFAADLSEVLGFELSAVQGEGDGIVFTTSTDPAVVALGEEGYTLSVTGSRVTVTAPTSGDWDATTGANWGAQTLLQAAEQGDGSLPQGEARDYPLYKVRGIILDVGRKTFTMDWLNQLVRQMAYYKLNDLNIHLNDNYIPIEQYVADGIDPADLEKGAYSGFRLESDITEGDTFTFGDVKHTARTDLTSTDLFYTKAEFREFIDSFAEFGVNISPEIDTPAHSLALTKVFPDLSYGVMRHRNRDHLDIINQYDQVVDMVKTVWDEYTAGDDAAFSGARYINIGADEFNVSGTGDHDTGNALSTGEAYRRFVNDLSNYMLAEGYTPRVWGSLSNYSGDNSIIKHPELAQVLLWNSGYAHMDEMYDMGYQLIFCDDGQYYIVPGATYYYDYLSPSIMYNSAINVQGSTTVPAGDPQMVGGMYAAWNDMIDRNEIGMSEYDIYDRLYQSMGLYGAKLWGKPAGAMSLEAAQGVMDDLGVAPGTNQAYAASANDEGTYLQLTMDDEADASGNGRGIGELGNASLEDLGYTGALKLNGGASCAEIEGIETLGLGSDLRAKVMRTSASAEDQVLFESPYGQIKAVQGATGKVGISREGYDYSFDYTLPVNEWVELEFKNTKDSTSLFVDGELVQTIGTGTRGQLHGTCMFPLARIGSESGAFEGYVTDVVATSSADVSTTEYASTAALLRAVRAAAAVSAEHEIAGIDALVEQASQLMDQVAPDGDAVAALTSQIEEAVASVDFEQADYGRVDALLSLVPSDEQLDSLFTPDSVESLRRAVSAIRRGLPAGMQDVVDGYEAALSAALAGLEPTEARDLALIDPALLKADACSQQSESGNEGPAANVLDGNTSTMWHTTWAGDGHAEHWISLTRADGAAMSVSGLQYTPRQSGSNGIITGYQVQVKATADSDWKTVAKGDWASNAQVKTVEFDAVECVAVRLYATASASDTAVTFGSAAEIRLVDGSAAADVDGLRAIVDAAAKISNDDGRYTPDSWQALQDAIAAARTLLESEAPDASKVEQVKKEVLDAQTSLVLAAAEPEPETYTVTFIDRIPGTEDTVLTVEAGSKLAEPAEPVLEGWVFGGWYVDGWEGGFTRRWDFETDTVTSDLTLTAQWTAAGGGSGETDPGESDPGATTPEEPPAKPGDGTGSQGSIPQTGDNMPAIVIGVAVAAVVLIVAGVVVSRRKRG